MKTNEVYGVSTDGIETTPNEVYGISTDGIETTPNEVYVIKCIDTPASEQRQPVAADRQSGPSPTHTYEDIHTIVI